MLLRYLTIIPFSFSKGVVDINRLRIERITLHAVMTNNGLNHILVFCEESVKKAKAYHEGIECFGNPKPQFI